jgi:hypothetical protein
MTEIYFSVFQRSSFGGGGYYVHVLRLIQIWTSTELEKLYSVLFAEVKHSSVISKRLGTRKIINLVYC